jgi:hypothetical protein
MIHAPSLTARAVPFGPQATDGPRPPRRPLRELRAALADGWELVQPIFVRPQWSALDDRKLALHFVLRRDHATRLVSLPETRALLRFVRQHAWRVQGR